MILRVRYISVSMHTVSSGTPSMRLVISLLLLAVLLLAGIPNNFCAASLATRPTKNITLYAHSDSSATSVGGRTLSATSVAGKRSTADVTKVVTFTLIPALVAPLHILGTVAVNVWLQSGQNVGGTLHAAVSEVLADGTVVQIRSANVTASVRQARPSGMIFAFGGVDHTLSKGSTIRLEAQFRPTIQTAVLLLWDDPTTPTSLTIQVEDAITLGIQIIGKNKRASIVFPTNDTGGPASLVAKVNVVDVFGSHDIRSVTLSIGNSTGFLVVSETPMVFTGEDPVTGSYTFELGVTAPEGRYRTSVTVRDTANNSYTASSEFLVTEFYPVTVVVSDLHGRPVRGAPISILLNSTVVESGDTDAEGLVHLSVPSSGQVAAFSIAMEYRGTEMILADLIAIRGHDMLRLEAPLSDWTILVRYQTFSFPIAGATVRIEAGNMTILSGTTAPDGSVTFPQIPAGTYTIMMESPSVKYQLTAEHSHDKATIQVDVPLAFALPTYAWLGVLMVVLASTFGIYAIRRGRRRRPRSFTYFKTLLGGALPSTSITMISGNPGSGKTQTIYSIMGEKLAENRPAVFVTNVEFPERVRAALKLFGIDAHTLEKKGNLRFVDCYTGMAGGESSEAHHVSSPTDLTALGVQVSACFAEVGGRGDVYLDSITPVVVRGKFERAFDFIRYYGARVKIEDCSFFYTASSSIESEALTKFEDEADCVIQLELYDSAGVTRRRLKVKKARGLSHRQDWIEFTINQRGEIEFHPE